MTRPSGSRGKAVGREGKLSPGSDCRREATFAVRIGEQAGDSLRVCFCHGCRIKRLCRNRSPLTFTTELGEGCGTPSDIGPFAGDDGGRNPLNRGWLSRKGDGDE